MTIKWVLHEIVLTLIRGSGVSIITSTCHCQLCTILNTSLLLFCFSLPTYQLRGLAQRNTNIPSSSDMQKLCDFSSLSIPSLDGLRLLPEWDLEDIHLLEMDKFPLHF